MRIGLSAVFALCAFQAVASDLSTATGEMVREMCKTDINAVYGFVVGAESALAYAKELSKLHETLSGYRGDVNTVETPVTDILSRQLCIPPTTSLQDKIGFFCKYLDLNNDEEMNKGNGFAAYSEAMNDVWPCQK